MTQTDSDGRIEKKVTYFALGGVHWRYLLHYISNFRQTACCFVLLYCKKVQRNTKNNFLLSKLETNSRVYLWKYIKIRSLLRIKFEGVHNRKLLKNSPVTWTDIREHNCYSNCFYFQIGTRIFMCVFGSRIIRDSRFTTNKLGTTSHQRILMLVNCFQLFAVVLT